MKVNLTQMGVQGLLWGSLSTVHLADKGENRVALCGYTQEPQYPNPIRLSAAPRVTICKSCLLKYKEKSGDKENI